MELEEIAYWMSAVNDYASDIESSMKEKKRAG
jgi:hypothetical protein